MTPLPDKREQFDSGRTRRKLLLYTLLLFAGVTAIVVLAIQTFGYVRVRAAWDHASPWVTAIKWGDMFILIWRWKDFVAWVANRWDCDTAWQHWVLRLRWRFAGALVLLELLFGQNLLAYIL